MYPTHLIYQALGKPKIDTELCNGICAFCGSEIQEGIKLENSVSDTFTNFDLLTDRTASHVCKCCYTCLKETKLRRMNFIATEQSVIYFKRDEIEKLLFNPPQSPFIFAVTESMKKHNSFKARVNYSQKLFYMQKEDTQILFSPNKYKDIFDAMKRLYRSFSKTAIGSGEYQQNFIKKYGLMEFMHDEEIIKNERGSFQFDLLLYAINMSEENLKKFKERKAK
jgi:CRISPR type IV-associated protein Csf1